MPRLSFLLLPLLCGFALGQTPRKSFEVATVKPHQTGSRVPNDGPQGNLYTYMGNLRMLVRYAYDLRDDQLTGGPNWMREAVLFDVSGKAEGNTTLTAGSAREMVQDLLAKRFQLRMHKETRDTAVYHLVTRGEPKMERTEAYRSIQFGPKGLVSQGGTMVELAELIAKGPDMDRPVIDKTGLSGNYVFRLLYARGNPPGRGPVVTVEGPTVFTAVQEQLGLRLEAAREKVDVWIVDSVQQPSEN